MPGIYIFIGAAVGAAVGLTIALIGKGETGLSRTLGGPALTVLVCTIIGLIVPSVVYQFAGMARSRSEHVIEIQSTEQFDNVVLKSDKPVLVKFYLPGCPPCRKMAPIVDEIAEETRGRAVVVSVHAGSQAELSDMYNIRAVPAFFIIRSGRVVKTFRSMQSKETLLNTLLNE